MARCMSRPGAAPIRASCRTASSPRLRSPRQAAYYDAAIRSSAPGCSSPTASGADVPPVAVSASSASPPPAGPVAASSPARLPRARSRPSTCWTTGAIGASAAADAGRGRAPRGDRLPLRRPLGAARQPAAGGFTSASAARRGSRVIRIRVAGVLRRRPNGPPDQVLGATIEFLACKRTAARRRRSAAAHAPCVRSPASPTAGSSRA